MRNDRTARTCCGLAPNLWVYAAGLRKWRYCEELGVLTAVMNRCAACSWPASHTAIVSFWEAAARVLRAPSRATAAADPASRTAWGVRALAEPSAAARDPPAADRPARTARPPMGMRVNTLRLSVRGWSDLGLGALDAPGQPRWRIAVMNAWPLGTPTPVVLS